MPAAVPETLGEVHVHFLGLCNYLSTLRHTKIVPQAAWKINCLVEEGLTYNIENAAC